MTFFNTRGTFRAIKLCRFKGLAFFSLSFWALFAYGLGLYGGPEALASESLVAHPKPKASQSDFKLDLDNMIYWMDSKAEVNLSPTWNPFAPTPPTAATRERVMYSRFSVTYAFATEDETPGHFELALPMRTTNSGAEFAGVETGFRYYFHPQFESLLQFSYLNSPSFNYVEPHYELSLAIMFKDSSETFQLGPQLIFPLALGHSSLDAHYGTEYGLLASLNQEVNFSEDLHFKAAVAFSVLRANSLVLGGIDQGGAGLINLSPKLGYDLMDNFWLNLSFNLPLARPQNREKIFSRAETPGLYGPSVSFGLEANLL